METPSGVLQQRGLQHALLRAPGAGEMGVGRNSSICLRLSPRGTDPESGLRVALCRFLAWVDVGAHHPAQSGPELPQHVHCGLVGSASTGMSDILGTRVLGLQEQLCREARTFLQLQGESWHAMSPKQVAGPAV